TPALTSQGSVRVLPKGGWLTLSLDATSTRGEPQPSMRGAAGLLLYRPLGLRQQRVHRAAMGGGRERHRLGELLRQDRVLPAHVGGRPPEGLPHRHPLLPHVPPPTPPPHPPTHHP